MFVPTWLIIVFLVIFLITLYRLYDLSSQKETYQSTIDEVNEIHKNTINKLNNIHESACRLLQGEILRLRKKYEGYTE